MSFLPALPSFGKPPECENVHVGIPAFSMEDCRELSVIGTGSVGGCSAMHMKEKYVS